MSAIQQELDKLDEAFLYSEAADITTYGRQRDRLREELTLAKIEHHAEAIDELDVQGILAFAARIPPRALRQICGSRRRSTISSGCSSCSSLKGIAFDGIRFNRTAATAPLFKYLARSESAESLVSRIFTSWNQLDRWLRQIEGLRRAA